MIADYMAAVEDGVNGTNNSSLGPTTTMSQAIAALSDISNKDVDEDVVNAVNDLLGIDEETLENDVSVDE